MTFFGHYVSLCAPYPKRLNDFCPLVTVVPLGQTADPQVVHSYMHPCRKDDFINQLAPFFEHLDWLMIQSSLKQSISQGKSFHAKLALQVWIHQDWRAGLLLSHSITNLSVPCEPAVEDLSCALNAKPRDSRGPIRILECVSMKPLPDWAWLKSVLACECLTQMELPFLTMRQCAYRREPTCVWVLRFYAIVLHALCCWLNCLHIFTFQQRCLNLFSSDFLWGPFHSLKVLMDE